MGRGRCTGGHEWERPSRRGDVGGIPGSRARQCDDAEPTAGQELLQLQIPLSSELGKLSLRLPVSGGRTIDEAS